MTTIHPVAAAPTGSLTGPAVALHDISLNDNDVKTPLKGAIVGEQYYAHQAATVVEESPRFDLLDCFVCWYCPGVFLVSRLCCPPPPQTTVRRVLINQPVTRGVPVAPMAPAMGRPSQ